MLSTIIDIKTNSSLIPAPLNCKAKNLETHFEDIRVCGELKDVPYGNPLRIIAFETNQVNSF